MNRRILLLTVMTLLLTVLACSLSWEPAEETALPAETEVFIPAEPEPTATTEILPTAVPTDILPIEPTKEPFACGPGMVAGLAFSVEFCYPGQYSSGYMQVRLPENPRTEDFPFWGFHPEMIEITLAGYPVENAYHDPIVRIYPVAELVAMDVLYQDQVSELQTLLTNQDPAPDSIPFVPVFNAAQVMQAQVTYLEFRNGSGVRFITMYSQDAAPISNDSAFYAFIGLTDDGSYLISATMPITHALFYPDVYTEPAEGWAAFSNNYTTYVSAMEANLLTQPQDTFFPHLTPLDAMMASFLIPPDAIP